MRHDETWLMPLGLMIDLQERHKQFLGMAKPLREAHIDEVIPGGV